MFFQETKGNTKKAILKWELHNVTSLEWQTKKRGEVVTSSEFHAVDDNQVKWCIQLFPNGKAADDRGWVSAFISPRIEPTYKHKINAQISFAVYDKDRREIFGGLMETTFGPHEPYKKSQGWSKIAKLADVLKDDFFWIIFEIDYADPNPPIKVSVLSSSDEEPTTSLSQDIIEQLFNNRLGTDVCFIIEEKEIRAHKAILLARSPVFAAMLESGMKETVENRVKIDDTAPDIFEALLRFVYTDRVDLNQLDVQDLLAAPTST